MYNFTLDIPKMGYFILYRNMQGGWLGNKIIKEQCNEGFADWQADWTHVEISGGGQWAVGAVSPKSKVINILSKYPGRYIKILRIKKDSFNKKRYKIAFWAATRCNLKYGWLALLYFKINHIFKKRNFLASINKPFCSFLAAWAISKEYNQEIFAIPPENIMPAHFAANKNFELVWEGYLPN